MPVSGGVALQLNPGTGDPVVDPAGTLNNLTVGVTVVPSSDWAVRLTIVSCNVCRVIAIGKACIAPHDVGFE